MTSAVTQHFCLVTCTSVTINPQPPHPWQKPYSISQLQSYESRKKSLVEIMAVERSGKKAWWKESLVCFGKDGKKPGVFIFRFDT